jgi:cytoskeletal protein CcmA (bactofilin family)
MGLSNSTNGTQTRAQTIRGNHNGDINFPVMDIRGVVVGDLCAPVEGDIHGTITGNLRSTVKGDIYGTINGNIIGTVFGSIRGVCVW